MNEILGIIDTCPRIVGYHYLEKLLSPGHKFFEGKRACMKGFKAYQAEKQKYPLLYPIVSGLPGRRLPKDNPMRKHQLARSHSGRRIEMLIKLIKTFKLVGFRMAFITLTMPKQVSEYLSKQKYGKDMAWRMFEKFWKWYENRFGEGLTCSVNLHTWLSGIPFLPHFHFHILILNYMWKMVKGLIDEEGSPCYEFVKREWHRWENGKYVPHSDKELIEIKAYWWYLLNNFGKRHGITWDADRGDLHIKYAVWHDEIGKIILMDWFNYQGRYPLEDYAIYSNKHLDCPVPGEWLTEYDNHARSFGWWQSMRKITNTKRKIENTKINPITGKKMQYMGHESFAYANRNGDLGYLNIVKGHVRFGILRTGQLYWLEAVQYENIKGTQVMQVDNGYSLDNNGIINGDQAVLNN